MPGIATQAAVTVHRSAGLLSPGVALAVLGGYAAIALTAASLRASHSDAWPLPLSPGGLFRSPHLIRDSHDYLHYDRGDHDAGDHPGKLP